MDRLIGGVVVGAEIYMIGHLIWWGLRGWQVGP